jgi:hypothetical protein
VIVVLLPAFSREADSVTSGEYLRWIDTKSKSQ